MNFAIIVAAGGGTRFGAAKPKQFLELAGKPIIFHTLERFEQCAAIDEIVLVLPTSEIEKFPRAAFGKLKKVVAGGATRADSVWNGLQAIDAPDAAIIAVHDGARPLVTVEEIAQTIEKAQVTGAACLVAPVVDTIKEVNGDQIIQTINRARLRRALTPQAFKIEILRRAFAAARTANVEFTDESMLVESLGVPVSTVEGSTQNIKITVPEDLILAETILTQFKV